MSQTDADLRRWEIPEIATFSSGPGGLTVLDITSRSCTGRVFLHGAHVTSWQPAGHEPVLFMSGSSHFASGKPIRGGVPVIFPWFGPRAGDAAAPAHGFARTSLWSVESLDADENAVTVILTLSDSDLTVASWPRPLFARYCVTFGRQLNLSLEIENRSDSPFEFEEALHTYFAVSDVRQVSVTGLENVEYIDKVDGGMRKRLDDVPLRFAGETDRVFLNTTGTCELHDQGVRRRIIVEKTGSSTTVVWNPWIGKAKAMADFGDDEWPQMLCIESANAADNAVRLRPRERHEMTARISVEAAVSK